MTLTLITGAASAGKSTLAASLPYDRYIKFLCGSEGRIKDPNAINICVAKDKPEQMLTYLNRLTEKGLQIFNFVKKHNLYIVFDSLTELFLDLTAGIITKKTRPTLQDWGSDRATPLAVVLRTLSAYAEIVPTFATVGHFYKENSKENSISSYCLNFGKEEHQQELLHACDSVLATAQIENLHVVLTPYQDSSTMPSSGYGFPCAQMYKRKFRNKQVLGEDEFFIPLNKRDDKEEIKHANVEGRLARAQFMNSYLHYCKDDSFGLKNMPESNEEYGKMMLNSVESAKTLKEELKTIFTAK